jgi:hypothetical protein
MAFVLVWFASHCESRERAMVWKTPSCQMATLLRHYGRPQRDSA